MEVFFFEPQDPRSDAARAEQDETLVEIRKHGKHGGIIAESDQALNEYQERGFRVLGVGPDAEIIRRGIQSTLEAVGART